MFMPHHSYHFSEERELVGCGRTGESGECRGRGRPLGPGAEAPLSLIRDRQEDLEAQRRAARQAAADVTNAVLGVAEGFQAYFPFLNPESERRDKVHHPSHFQKR